MSAGLGKGETHERLGNQGRLVTLFSLALAGRHIDISFHLSSSITQLTDVLHNIRGSSLYLSLNYFINIQVLLSQSGTAIGVPTCSNSSRPVKHTSQHSAAL